MSAKSIETIIILSQTVAVDKQGSIAMKRQGPLTLVLGSTGKTGSRVTAALIKRGLSVRSAARSRADVTFDWSRRDSYAPALDGVGRVYLVAPVMRLDFSDDISEFLDKAEAAGVQHITFLSAYGIEHAPDKVATRSVELDLLRRQRIGHTILRPAWFMQNFSQTFLKPLDGAIFVPTGDGTEAFIDAEDIAAVAATTLADPQAHAGEAYSLTGPEALTVAEAAAIISEETGSTIKPVNLDRDAWITGAIANGISPEYGPVLRQLTEAIASGHGSRPNGTVEKITGTPPRTFRTFAHENANAWKAAK
jgi:uncharacterized protein YbjT (DUF2867 family)